MDIVGHSSPAYGMGSNCGDLIFSGHTAGAFVWLYCIIKELNKRCISLYCSSNIWLVNWNTLFKSFNYMFISMS